jgi:hypothetical protein
LSGQSRAGRARLDAGQLLRAVAGRARWLAKRKLAAGSLTAAERLNERFLVGLEYPTSALNAPRYGHGRPVHPELDRVIREHAGAYRASLETIVRFAGDLRRIERKALEPMEPSWSNDMLPPLDAAALYAFLRASNPRRYIEIGSGNSTRFAARAKRDGRLTTELISIDPHPRVEIDALCDRVIRSPLESIDLEVFASIEGGDVVFFDGSHRVFTNSDATVFFLDVVPGLAPGAVVGVHDIYLPEDYPPEISHRYYSEQYLLACWLLAGDRAEPLLPAAFVHRESGLSSELAPLWDTPELRAVGHHGASFWWRVA